MRDNLYTLMLSWTIVFLVSLFLFPIYIEFIWAAGIVILIIAHIEKKNINGNST